MTWHPISGITIPGLDTFASPRLLRQIVASRDPGALSYSGDRMEPGLRHGAPVPTGTATFELGRAVIVEQRGVLDIYRICALDGDRIGLTADADPGPIRHVERKHVLGGVEIPPRLPSVLARRLRRLGIQLRETWKDADRIASDPAQSVRDRYDTQAPFYPVMPGPGLGEALLQDLRSRHAPPSRVLVAGSGTGRECVALARLGYRVTGVDFSAAMVDVARRRVADTGLEIPFHVSDLRRYDHAGEPQDSVVFTGNVYSLIPGRESRVAFLHRIGTWLRPSGTLYLGPTMLADRGEAALLTLRRLFHPRSEWGDTHTRWISPDGAIRRSYHYVFTQGTLRRETVSAGIGAGRRIGGHVAFCRPAER